MNYIDYLQETARKNNSIVCFGMDPIMEKIPLKGSTYGRIVKFYETILNRMVKDNILPGAVKPNYAFYAQYGLPGIKSLHTLIQRYREARLPVILDVKRGDIGSTAAAYAKESFEFFQADAVTLSPYMGYDSLQPFIAGYPDKGYYILTRTSNQSSPDIQDIASDGVTVYEKVARKIIEWDHPGIGSVVGATYPEELEKIASIYNDSGKSVPLLIPGVGSQGGSLKDILGTIGRTKNILVHRINSSSALNFAYISRKEKNFAAASVSALHELNSEINELLNGYK